MSSRCDNDSSVLDNMTEPPTPALELLPYDAWVEVFDHANATHWEGKEIVAARRTCKLFNEFLEPFAFRRLWGPWYGGSLLQLKALCHAPRLRKYVHEVDFKEGKKATASDLKLFESLRQTLIDENVLFDLCPPQHLRSDILYGLGKGHPDALYAVAIWLCPRLLSIDMYCEGFANKFKETLIARSLRHAVVPVSVQSRPLLETDLNRVCLSFGGKKTDLGQWHSLLSIPTVREVEWYRVRIFWAEPTRGTQELWNLTKIEFSSCKIAVEVIDQMLGRCHSLESLLIRWGLDDDYRNTESMAHMGDVLRRNKLHKLKTLKIHICCSPFSEEQEYKDEIALGDLSSLKSLEFLEARETCIFGRPHGHRFTLTDILPTSIQNLKLREDLDTWPAIEDIPGLVAMANHQLKLLTEDLRYSNLNYVELERGGDSVEFDQIIEPDEGSVWADEQQIERAAACKSFLFVRSGYTPSEDEDNFMKRRERALKAAKIEATWL